MADFEQVARKNISRRIVCVLALFLLPLAHTSWAQSDPRQPLTKEIDGIVRSQADKSATSGLAVAVVHRNKIIHLQGYGHTDTTRASAVGTNTRFHAASISKLFTTIAILRLVENGKISIDDDIARFLPQFSSKGITVRRLLTHTSGLRDPIRLRTKDSVDDKTSYLSSLAAQNLASQDHSWRYADANFNVLGAVIQRVTGMPFADHMDKAVLEPLDMRMSEFRASKSAASPSTASPYGSKDSPHPFNEIHAPSSGLQTTIEDLAKFVLVMVNGSKVDGSRLLSRDSIRRMWTIESETSLGNLKMGLGWQIDDSKSHALYMHSGDEGGFQSRLVIDPANGTGVVVLGNSRSVPRFEIAEMVLGFLETVPFPTGNR